MQNKIITTLITLCVISTTTHASLSGKKIGLDPGHGGDAPGAHSPSEETAKEPSLSSLNISNNNIFSP